MTCHNPFRSSSKVLGTRSGFRGSDRTEDKALSQSSPGFCANSRFSPLRKTPLHSSPSPRPSTVPDHSAVAGRNRERILRKLMLESTRHVELNRRLEVGPLSEKDSPESCSFQRNNAEVLVFRKRTSVSSLAASSDQSSGDNYAECDADFY